MDKEKSEEIKEVQKELPREEVKSELDQAREKAEEFKNKYLRALADFDNYKKRVAFEQDGLIQFSNEKIIAELLPALDNFERALEAAEKAKIADDILKGIALIKKQMEDTFIKFGVSEIPALDRPYDANLHEAILQKESEKPSATIIEVVQKGYKLHERVIRPSMVIVSKGGK